MLSAVKSALKSETVKLPSSLTTSEITSALLVAKSITRPCAVVAQYQRVCCTSASATPSADSWTCEKPLVGEVGSVSGTRAGLVPPAWLYASTSSQHVPSTHSR